MSRANWKFLKTTNKILKEGCWDTAEVVRPKWKDGQPAHTAKLFAVNNVYNLAKEFPLISLRDTNWKAAIDEVLWIWQKKDNNVNNLHSKIWNAWADENGSIGKAYGWQLAQKAKYPMGEMDQVDMVIYYLKHQPAFRSILTELFVHKDLHEMGLYPCVHGAQFDVSTDKDGNKRLNLFLNQRSNDMLVAGNWNVAQYAALVYMLAQVCDLEVGKLSHMIGNCHIYDRHTPFVVDMTLSCAQDIEQRLQAINFDNICNLFSCQEARDKFEKFMMEVLSEDMEYGELLSESEFLQKNPYKTAAEFEDYVKRVVDTAQFKMADNIVCTLSKNPEFEKALGIQSPKLKLEEGVKDFYAFQSPLTFDENKKVVDNKTSSFSVEDYNSKQEGIKFKERIPVAE